MMPAPASTTVDWPPMARGGFKCFRRLVETRIGHPQGEARQRLARNARGGRQHIGRVHAAAEIADHRHVGAQPDLDGTGERLLESIDGRLFVRRIVLLAPIGKVEVPVFASRPAWPPCRRRPRRSSNNDPARVACTPSNAVRRPPSAKKVKRWSRPRGSAFGVTRAGGEQRFDLGTEIQEVALARPE